MKKIILAAFIFLTISFSIVAQTISPALQEANKLSGEVVKLFQQGKFKEALPIAQKVVEIEEKELGKNDIEVAKALANLGYVYYLLENNKQSQAAFERSVGIFESKEKLSKEVYVLVAGMLEKIALIKYDNNNPNSTENYLKKSLVAYEKAGEQNSAKAANVLFSLGNLSSANRKYNDSADFFTKSLDIRINNLGEKSGDTVDVFERCACVLKKAGKEKEIKLVQEKFFPKDELLEGGTLKLSGLTTKSNILLINGGVVNGKALNLAKPAYPVEARQVRAKGAIKVRVKIDERGNVVFACGAFNDNHPALIEASEAAAFSSKFSPTSLNGELVKVTGVIVYNFMP